jgi:phosphate transport system protein
MRIQFQERLEEIRSEVLRMGSEANEMVRMAVDATLNGDLELAQQVLHRDDDVDDLEKRALDLTVLTMMSEAPVAADLKFLVSTLSVVGEIEKVGDDAVKLARRATKLRANFPTELKVSLLDIGELARRSFAASLKLYVEFSPELSEEIILQDEEVDTAYSRARDRLLTLIEANPSATEHLVRSIECFHALEHVADHAVAIAKRLSIHYK